MKFAAVLLMSVAFAGSAFAGDTKYVGTGFCDQAVSAVECAKARVYVASIKPTNDTSPVYMRLTDPRYNEALTRGGAGGDGGGAAGN